MFSLCSSILNIFLKAYELKKIRIIKNVKSRNLLVNVEGSSHNGYIINTRIHKEINAKWYFDLTDINHTNLFIL